MLSHHLIKQTGFVRFAAKLANKLYNISVFLSLQELDSLRARVAQEEVNVEVDVAHGPELGTVLSELRSQYEGIVHKNKEEAENWYRKKVGSPGEQNQHHELKHHCIAMFYRCYYGSAFFWTLTKKTIYLVVTPKYFKIQMYCHIKIKNRNY